jgi:predicted RNA-binding protein with TRAM domain
LNRPRSHEKYVNKGNHFGGSKAPRASISVGEEYSVTIEEMGKDGSGVARLRGVSTFVDSTNPGDKVKVRNTELGRTHASAEVFGQYDSVNFPFALSMSTNTVYRTFASYLSLFVEPLILVVASSVQI